MYPIERMTFVRFNFHAFCGLTNTSRAYKTYFTSIVAMCGHCDWNTPIQEETDFEPVIRYKANDPVKLNHVQLLFFTIRTTKSCHDSESGEIRLSVATLEWSRISPDFLSPISLSVITFSHQLGVSPSCACAT